MCGRSLRSSTSIQILASNIKKAELSTLTINIWHLYLSQRDPVEPSVEGDSTSCLLEIIDSPI